MHALAAAGDERPPSLAGACDFEKRDDTGDLAFSSMFAAETFENLQPILQVEDGTFTVTQTPPEQVPTLDPIGVVILIVLLMGGILLRSGLKRPSS